MKRNIKRGLFCLLMVLLTFFIVDNVYASPKKVCSYLDNRLDVYYDDETKILTTTTGNGYGTLSSPGMSLYYENAQFDGQNSWFVKNIATAEFEVVNIVDNQKGYKFTSEPEIVCPTLYYSKTNCKYSGSFTIPGWAVSLGVGAFGATSSGIASDGIYIEGIDYYACDYTFSNSNTNYIPIESDVTTKYPRTSCLYDNILMTNYNDVVDKRYAYYNSYSLPQVSKCVDASGKFHAGTTSDPCLVLGTVSGLEMNGIQLKLGTSDNGGWQFINSEGVFGCPDIYHSKSCRMESDGKYYCIYSYSPSPLTGYSLVSSSIHATIAPKVDVSELPLCNITEEEWKNVDNYTYDPSHPNPNVDLNVAEFLNTIKELRKDYAETFDYYIEKVKSCTSRQYDPECSTMIYGNSTRRLGNEVTKTIESPDGSVVYTYKYIPLISSSNSFEDVIKIKSDSTTLAILDAIVAYIQKANCRPDSAMIEYFITMIDEITDKKQSEFNAAVDANNDLSNDDKDKYKNTIEKGLAKVGRFTDRIGSWYNQLLDIPDDTCTGYLDPELVSILNTVFNWVKIIVPIMVIIFGILDFSKAVLSAEKDELKQASTKLAKRIVIAILIFFIPSLISVLVNAFNAVSPIPLTDLPECGIK